jgi:hypothetical protein
VPKLKGKRPTSLGTSIPVPPKPKDQFVSFSFKYLDLVGNSKFTLGRCDNLPDYVHKLLDRIRAIEGMRVNEFRFGGSDALRCHAIEWESTSEESGFSHLNSQLRANSPWQFCISANEHGRVHGFFIESVFYLIWLDPKHLLYKNA